MKVLGVMLSLLFLVSLGVVSGARILALLPLAARSHHNFHQGVLKALASRGHEVVVYGPFPQPTPIPNYTDVYLNTYYNEDFITYDLLIHLLKTKEVSGMRAIWNSFDGFSEVALKHENIRKLIKSGEQFDLVIVEAFMGQEALLVFGHIFKAPTIVLQPFGTFSLVNKVMGNSLALPHVPEFNLPFSNRMSLYERLINSFSIMWTLITYYSEQIPLQDSVIRQQLNLSDVPPLSQMIDNIALVFTNNHPITSYPQPLPPNIVPLGGIHLTKDRKPLTQDLLSFMDEANHGVIYFSLGTCVPDHKMPEAFYQQFLRVFTNLKQKVIWKTRRKNIIDVPSNVIIKKWVPQQDLLAHPNLVLFITHGGLLSLHEVSHAGVPVVGIPFFADQPMDVAYYEAKGTGVKLDFLSISNETISKAINTVLNDPKYKENAVKLSRIVQDIPLSQQDLAVYWTEHVLRHAGDHLKPTAANLSWYKENTLKMSRMFQDIPMSQQDLAVYWTKHVLRNGGNHLKPTAANLAWYKENAMKLSRMFQDIPMSQQDLAVYWTEHVLRHGGDHLKPTAANLAWYQLMLLDIVTAILAAILITIFAAYILCQMIIQRFRHRSITMVHKKKRLTDSVVSLESAVYYV